MSVIVFSIIEVVSSFYLSQLQHNFMRIKLALFCGSCNPAKDYIQILNEYSGANLDVKGVYHKIGEKCGPYFRS